VLVGDGAELEALQEVSRALGLEGRVWFHGACYKPEKLAQLFEWADVVASPGNVGLTAIHALRHGTPVITHDNPLRQMPEAEAIRDGENGALFAEGDPADLARTLTEWFERHPQKTDALRARCKNVVNERYNSRSQAQRILEALGLESL
jgi:Glycosyltransferase